MKPFLIAFTSVALLTPAAFGADIKPDFAFAWSWTRPAHPQNVSDLIPTTYN